MRKYVLTLLMAGISTSIFAQTPELTPAMEGEISGETKIMETQIDGSKFADASAQLADIDISFCGTPDKQINLEALPNEKVPLCIQASNNSDSAVSVMVKFVDGVFTNDQWKTRACQTDDKTSLFGQYVTGHETILHLDPHSVVKQMPNFQYTQANTGIIYGCLVYYIKNISGATTGAVNFDIQIRKAKFIDMDIVTQKKADRDAALLAEQEKTPINTYIYIILGALAVILIAAKLIIGKKKTPITIVE